MMMDKVQKPFTGRKMLMWVVGFFAIVIGVNLIMVRFAVGGFSGLETEDAYKKGRAYNEEIAARKREAALGWVGTLSLTDTTFRYQLETKTGTTMASIGEIILELRFAGNPEADQTLVMTPGKDGVYRAPLASTKAGHFSATVRVRDGASAQLFSSRHSGMIGR